MAGTVDGGQHVAGHADELVLGAVDSNVDHGLEHVRHFAPVASRHHAGHDSYLNAGDGHGIAVIIATEVEVVQVLGMEGGPGVHDGPQRDLGHGSERELGERELVAVEGAREVGCHGACGGAGDAPVMLAKAVASQTNANIIRMVGSEFVQKYLGEGPRMVRDVFRLAKENSPSIIFIDEVDAIATKRFDANTGADREVQRILIELLQQMDGFDQTTNVKCIMATNRADTLDPALLRPGRLDRKIEFPLPDRRQKRLVF